MNLFQLKYFATASKKKIVHILQRKKKKNQHKKTNQKPCMWLYQKAKHSISLQVTDNITAVLMPFIIGCVTSSMQLEACKRNWISFVHHWKKTQEN